MEIPHQILKLPKITGSFLSRGLNVKFVSRKSRTVCNYLKENRSCLEFCR